jgi:hypothetical protein
MTKHAVSTLIFIAMFYSSLASASILSWKSDDFGFSESVLKGLPVSMPDDKKMEILSSVSNIKITNVTEIIISGRWRL